MVDTSGVLAELPSPLARRLPISFDGVVAEGPEFVNHGANYQRWRLRGPDGTPVGQVRVYVGRADERGNKEHVYIPAPGEKEQGAFSLPHADDFSSYLQGHLEAYLASQRDETPVTVALRKGPTIVGVMGSTYFLRWNIYFKDEKIGEYTVHDMNPDNREDAVSHEGERSYRGVILGYINPHVVMWNEAVCLGKGLPTERGTASYKQGIKEGYLLPPEAVSLRWGRTLAPETPDNRFSFTHARMDKLDIPFP